MKTEIADTADKIIDALGGTVSAARVMGLVPSMLSAYRHRGKIPAAKYLMLKQELERRGYAISTAAFSFTCPQEPDDAA